MVKFLKNLWKRIRPFLPLTITALMVGALSALLSGDSMASFELLKKPPLSPPAWLFPVVWTVLYILMGVSATLVSRQGSGTERSLSLLLWGAQLTVNFFWTLLFFLLQWRLTAFFWLLLLLALAAAMTLSFSTTSKKAAYLQIPYILWIAFAGYLNLGVWMLNR